MLKFSVLFSSAEQEIVSRRIIKFFAYQTISRVRRWEPTGCLDLLYDGLFYNQVSNLP